MLINSAEDTLWEALSNRGLEMREELECIKGCNSKNGMESLVLFTKLSVFVVSILLIIMSVEEKVLAFTVNGRMAVSVKKINFGLSEKTFLINMGKCCADFHP